MQEKTKNIDWSDPNILYLISNKELRNDFDAKKAALEIIKYNSLEDVVFNWLENDFKNNNQIRESLPVWKILDEMGYLHDKEQIIVSKSNEDWMKKFGGPFVSKYVYCKAIPAVKNKIINKYNEAIIEETTNRFLKSMESYFECISFKSKSKSF